MNFWVNRFKSLGRRPTDTRHAFVIGPLCKSAIFQQKARLYYCVRCKWSFLVCGGKVVVLDEDGGPLSGDVSHRRFATFEEGPCPVLEAFVSAASFNTCPLEPQSRKECDVGPGHLAPSHLHVRFNRPRLALRVVSRTREDSARSQYSI